MVKIKKSGANIEMIEFGKAHFRFTYTSVIVWFKIASEILFPNAERFMIQAKFKNDKILMLVTFQNAMLTGWKEIFRISLQNWRFVELSRTSFWFEITFEWFSVYEAFILGSSNESKAKWVVYAAARGQKRSILVTIKEIKVERKKYRQQNKIRLAV